jgi:hypothetical protein
MMEVSRVVKYCFAIYDGWAETLGVAAEMGMCAGFCWIDEEGGSNYETVSDTQF